MIICLDVAYRELPDPVAVAGGIIFRNWSDDQVVGTTLTAIPGLSEYVPGQFYKRELPPILAVLDQIQHPIDAIIVDGYVQLSSTRPGLGQKLYELPEIGGAGVAVVGVAKKRFHENDLAIPVTRGKSKQPLYVTAMGMPIDIAANRIGQMPGQFRIPTVLKKVDQLVREKLRVT